MSLEKSSMSTAEKMEERISSVTDRYENTAQQAEKAAQQAQESMPEQEDKVVEAQKVLDRQKQELEELMSKHEQERAKFWGLGSKFGENRRKSEQEIYERRMEESRSNLEAERISQQKLEEERQYKIQEMKKSEELRYANSLNVGVETSKGMSEALRRQDMTALLAREGYLDNNQETEYLPSLEFLNTTLTEMRGLPLDKYNRDRITPETAMMDVMPFIESATKYATEHNLELSENLLRKALLEGIRITDLVGSNEVWNYVRQKRGDSIRASDIGYYEIASCALEKFFRNRPNIKGEAKVPYVMAYLAGAMTNTAPMYMDFIGRNLLAEVIPVKGLDGRWNRTERKWEPSEEVGELGIGKIAGSARDGYLFVTGKTRSIGVVEAYQKAGEIFSDCIDKHWERRSRSNFIWKRSTIANGLNFGKNIPAPQLLEEEI